MGLKKTPNLGFALPEVFDPATAELVKNFEVADGILEGGKISFVFKATGVNDNVKISTLVRNFLDAQGDFIGTTARSLRLDVVGKLGLSISLQQDSGGQLEDVVFSKYFDFSSDNPSGRNVYINWAGAEIIATPSFPYYSSNPSYTHATMMYHKGVGSIIHHENLNLKFYSSNSPMAVGNTIAFVNDIDSTVSIRNCRLGLTQRWRLTALLLYLLLLGFLSALTLSG